jgi:hypothetical protein
MHLLHEKGVAYTSIMEVMRPLSLFPPPYYHYARLSNTFTYNRIYT